LACHLSGRFHSLAGRGAGVFNPDVRVQGAESIEMADWEIRSRLVLFDASSFHVESQGTLVPKNVPVTCAVGWGQCRRSLGLRKPVVAWNNRSPVRCAIFVLFNDEGQLRFGVGHGWQPSGARTFVVNEVPL
jgi:hypothetical protein